MKRHPWAEGARWLLLPEGFSRVGLQYSKTVSLNECSRATGRGALHRGKTEESMEPQFNQEKFTELIVYIAEQSKDDPFFGPVKLNKILYYADFRAYRELGHSITGASYRKLTEGSCPPPVLTRTPSPPR